MRPEPGTFFISQYNTLCRMDTIDSYIDWSFKGRSGLGYAEGTKFSSKRMATDMEIHEQRYIPLMLQEQAAQSHKDFTITLPGCTDTRMGLATLEASYIEHVLELAKYNKAEAAKMLGISRGTLISKLKQYFGRKYIGKRSRHA